MKKPKHGHRAEPGHDWSIRPAPLQHRRTWRQRSENPYVIAGITLVVNHANTAANANSEKYDRFLDGPLVNGPPSGSPANRKVCT
jgi:hypothetical protein